MTATTHHDLKSQLKAAGWRIAKRAIYDDSSAVDWYAWHPARKSARNCCSNRRPPSVTVDPFEFQYSASAEVRLAGELPNGRWVDFRVYNIPMRETMGALPDALVTLEAAWVAAWDAAARQAGADQASPGVQS